MYTRMAKSALCASFAFAALSANALVVNGSFEDNKVAPRTFITPSSILGWNSTNGIEIRNDVQGTAQHGSNFVELDTKPGQPTSNSTIWQVVNTVVGQEYRLSFWYSPRIGISSPADTNNINLFWGSYVSGQESSGGALVEGRNPTASGSGAGLLDHDWQLYSFLVYGSGNDIIRFAAAGTGETLGGSIDNVSLTATPLPGAALLFGTSIAGFLAARKRKKAAALAA